VVHGVDDARPFDVRRELVRQDLLEFRHPGDRRYAQTWSSLLEVNTTGVATALAILASLRAFCLTKLMPCECVHAIVPI
jgi:hypothetical protein